jgi:hypothetical protein
VADYRKLVQSEAKKFYESTREEFEKDSEEFGGNSDNANYSKWLERTGRLEEVVGKVVEGWGTKDFQWVQQNTRNANRFGDPRSNAFASFYSDVLHELKKLNKRSV